MMILRKLLIIFSPVFVSNLNIPRYQDPFIDSHQTENRIGHLILRIIEQYKNHPSIIAVNNQNMDRRVSFKKITKSEINLEILNLDSSKACKNQIFQRRLSKQTLISSQNLYTRSLIEAQK